MTEKRKSGIKTLGNNVYSQLLKKTLILILFFLVSCKEEKLSDFQSIHLMSKNLFESELRKIRGESVEKVFYVIANYQDRENQFKKFDLVDEAIFVQLTNNKFISWIWNDEGPEIGYYYGLYFKDLKDAVKKRNKDGIEFLKKNGLYEEGYESIWQEVTNSENWSKFIGKKLKNIQFKTKRTSDSRIYISEFKLNFDGKSISIYSTEEPEPDDYKNVKDLEFAPDWTIVVFDETILN